MRNVHSPKPPAASTMSGHLADLAMIAAAERPTALASAGASGTSCRLLSLA